MKSKYTDPTFKEFNSYVTFNEPAKDSNRTNQRDTDEIDRLFEELEHELLSVKRLLLKAREAVKGLYEVE